MTGRSPAVDAYLEGASEHARPVLRELRDRVHEPCPVTEEALKWGMPTFNRHGVFASMADLEAFSPSARREYVEWITGAKREATRQKRLEQAIEWIAEGKQRNWKYM